MNTCNEDVGHLTLIVHHLALLRRRLATARDGGAADPVVLVLDLRDDRARWIAESLGENEGIATRVAAKDRLGQSVVAIAALSRADACDLVREFGSDVAVALAAAGREGDEIVVVAHAAVSLQELTA